jgi:hypothetical protein
VIGRPAKEQCESSSRGNAREDRSGEAPAAKSRLGRGGFGVAGGTILRHFAVRDFDGGMDGGGALAPEVIGCEPGDVGLGRGRGGLAERDGWAERDEFVGRAEPVAGEADDLVRRVRRPATLDFTTFLHPVADLFQLFLAMPSESGASIRLD